MKHVFLMSLLFPLVAFAADADYTLVIKDHRFEPNELVVPSGKRLTLRIENKDDTPEEFDSHAMNREKMIAAQGSITIFIGPLDTGRYLFDGELHEASAKGVIIVR